jgi:hypothetical protein
MKLVLQNEELTALTATTAVTYNSHSVLGD